MAKWADYLISSVDYKNNHIDKVGVREDSEDNNSISKPSIGWSREKVIEEIEAGKKIITIFKNSEGKWCEGEEVMIISVKGEKYIKTESNDTEEDNLGELPRLVDDV